jgi:hypothetical protein
MRQLRPLSLGSLCLLLALGAPGCNDDDPSAFTATLAASSEVPPNSSSATGTATLSYDGDSSVQFRIEVHSIADVTGAHIHSGAQGTNGSVRVTLFDDALSGAVDGELVQGSFGPADVEAGMSFDSLLEEMRTGEAYVNVHTATHPDGEIRGQVRLVE